MAVIKPPGVGSTAEVVGTDVQAQDADLEAIAGLSPANDDIIQRKSGAWTNRTLAQVRTDLAVGTELGLTEILATTGSNLTVTTTQADVTGLTVTVTVPSGCSVFVEAELSFIQGNASATFIAMRIHEDGSQIKSSVANIASGQFGRCKVSRSRSPSAGSHTYKVQCNAGGGAGTYTLLGLTNEPTGYIRVTAR